MAKWFILTRKLLEIGNAFLVQKLFFSFDQYNYITTRCFLTVTFPDAFRSAALILSYGRLQPLQHVQIRNYTQGKYWHIGLTGT